MRRRVALAVAVTALVLPATASAGAYVVKFHDSTTDPAAATSTLERGAGFRARFVYSAALHGFAATLTDSQVKYVRASSSVETVEADTVQHAAGTPVAAGETVPPGIRRIGAATLTTAAGPADSSIAVLDSGVDLANADLNSVSGTNCISPGTAAQDNNGHGTNVAGIAAAMNSGAGVVGVAPGTRVVSVKVLDAKAAGTLSQIICGIDWVTANAAAQNIRVANMSISGAGANDGNCGNTNNDLEHQAICRSTAAGITYVVAAGNAKVDFAKTIPAAYPEVLTATAITDTDGRAGGSGAAPKCKSGETDDKYGSYTNFAVSAAAQAHTIAAPGTCVVSDAVGGGTSTYWGTSQAAPHVAGAVARCFGSGGLAGACSGLAPAAAIGRVRSDAAAHTTIQTGYQGDPLRPVTGRYFGYLTYAGGY